MFAYFERLVDPYPPEHPSQPPQGLYAFCRHYTLGIAEWIAAPDPAVFDAYVGAETSLALMLLTILVALLLASRKLEEVEVREAP